MNEESKSTPISLKLAGAALLLCISLMIPAMLPVESEGTSTAAAQADGKSIMTHPEVMLIQIDGTINPATAEYILNSISKAENEKVSALVIEMNTPGGPARIYEENCAGNIGFSGADHSLYCAERIAGRICRGLHYPFCKRGGHGTRHKHRRGPSCRRWNQLGHNFS